MKITFDPAKRNTALNERGLDFVDAEIVFAGQTITVRDARKDYGEARYQTVGYLAGRMVMVVWTCNAREKAIYQKRFGQA